MRLRRQILASSSPPDESVRLADKGLLDPAITKSCCFLFVTRFVVFFEPIEQRRLGRIEAERFELLNKPFPLFRIVVRICLRDFVAPAFEFIRRFLLAAAI